jgi:hypothetical protein
MNKDITEILQNSGAESLLTVVRNARPISTSPTASREHRLPPIVDVSDFLKESLPKPPELVHGILHKGSKMVLSGSSKSRKTWSLTHLGMCVASGKQWWGFKTERGKVLYMNFEIPKWAFQRRIQWIREKLELTEADLKQWFQVWNLRGAAADITDLVDEVVERTKDKYDLIILDPIYKVLGDRDENSNSDIASMMNEIDRIVEESGAAVIFGHHFSKGNQANRDAMDRMSGAGAFARDADSLLVMTRHQLPDTYSVEAILRNHKPIAPFCVTVDDPILERWDAADPSKLKKIGGVEKKYTLEKLMQVLGKQEVLRAELQRQFCKETGASEGSFDSRFKEGVELGYIVKAADGKGYKASGTYPGTATPKTEPKNGAIVQE